MANPKTVSFEAPVQCRAAHRLYLAILCLLLPFLVQADRFDEFVKTAMEEQKIPGVQFVVVFKGKVAMSRSYGFADLDKKTPVTKDTEFEIASVSKPIVATAVMMLCEQGKFKIEEPIGKYVEDMPLAWANIPIVNLLSHTSGIPDFRGGDLYFQHRMDETPFADITKGMSTDLLFNVGDHFAYSNTNYLMLGKLIEGLTGKPYTEFLQTQIFDPLGMKATGFVSKKEHCQGYVSVGKEFRPSRDCSLAWAGPGSSIVSNAEDLAKFDEALQNQKLIKNQTLIRMLQPTETKLGAMDYGLGWQIGKVGDVFMSLHSGKMNGFSSVFLRLINEKISVIVLSNANESDENTLSRGILGLYFPEMDPKKLTPIVDDDPSTTKAHQRILLSIMAEVPDMDAFTADYKAHVTEEKLKAMGAEMARGGRIRPLQVIRRYAKGQFQAHEYLVTQGKSQLLVTFFVDDKGKIGGLKVDAP